MLNTTWRITRLLRKFVLSVFITKMHFIDITISLMHACPVLWSKIGTQSSPTEYQNRRISCKVCYSKHSRVILCGISHERTRCLYALFYCGYFIRSLLIGVVYLLKLMMEKCNEVWIKIEKFRTRKQIWKCHMRPQWFEILHDAKCLDLIINWWITISEHTNCLLYVMMFWDVYHGCDKHCMILDHNDN